MNVQLVPFSEPDRLEALGISTRAVSGIFLGEWPDTPAPDIVEGASDVARWFARREHAAAGNGFAALRRRRLDITDPWTGQALTCTAGFTAPARGALPYDLVPLFYPFRSGAGHDFWLIGHSLYGRISHIYLPAQEIVICDFERDTAPALAEQAAQLPKPPPPAGPPRTVGIVDMVLNSGHQLMNHLSGLDRLLDEGGPDLVDEIWVAGVEFFPPVETLFPELAPRIRRFGDRWAMHAELSRGDTLPVRIGANIFRRGMIGRLRPRPAEARTAPWPLLAVTVRAEGRRCLNLAAVVETVVRALRGTYPQLGIVLDGWVVPDGQLVAGSAAGAILADGFHRSRVAGAIEVAREIAGRLPAGTIVRNLIGTSMSDSVAGLADIDAYLAHVGTLQHKIAFLTGAPGVVHGPVEQLAHPDTGHFQAERGVAPLFLDSAAVRDTSPGDRSSDYEIADVGDIVRKLEQILELQASRRTT